MEYEEYMTSLVEQIHDKRAKRLVEQEIANHIEEQTESYELDGMSHNEAVRESVRQMGNPVEIGVVLNKIHKAKTPWMMIALAAVLMLITTMMHVIIFREGADYEWNWNWDGVFGQAISYHVIAIVLMIVVFYIDYNFIAKYAYWLYVGYMLFMLVCVIGAGRPFLEILHSASGHYGLQTLFPILLAGIIYRNRNRGRSGILICMGLGLAEILWHLVLYSVSRSTPYYSAYPAVAESMVIMCLMFAGAIWKGIFGKKRKELAITFGIIVAIVMVLFVGGIIMTGGMGSYIWRRIFNVFVQNETSYINVAMQEAIAQSDWLGGSFFVGGVAQEIHYATLLNSIITYFGKVAGTGMILVYVLFLFLSLKMSLKQNNRIGFIVGIACTASLFVRLITYVAMNFGMGLWWTTMAPFFGYGRMSAVTDGIFIGLLLCVYRNSWILKEDSVPQRKLPRIRVMIE